MQLKQTSPRLLATPDLGSGQGAGLGNAPSLAINHLGSLFPKLQEEVLEIRELGGSRGNSNNNTRELLLLSSVLYRLTSLDPPPPLSEEGPAVPDEETEEW